MQASPQSSITRRRHSAAFKAEVLAECRRSGASVAAVAQMYGINANLVHKWRRDSLELVSAEASSAVVKPVGFIELPMPLPTAVQAPSQLLSNIEVELQRGKVLLKVRWPVSALAGECGGRLCGVVARGTGVIRVEAVWMATAPLDMRAGTDSALAQVVAVFGAAQPHHAYVFANRSGNRLKVLVHDGIGIWLAARRLHRGRFVWAGLEAGPQVALTREQLDALVLGLPWQRVGPGGAIRLVEGCVYTARRHDDCANATPQPRTARCVAAARAGGGDVEPDAADASPHRPAHSREGYVETLEVCPAK